MVANTVSNEKVGFLLKKKRDTVTSEQEDNGNKYIYYPIDVYRRFGSNMTDNMSGVFSDLQSKNRALIVIKDVVFVPYPVE